MALPMIFTTTRPWASTAPICSNGSTEPDGKPVLNRAGTTFRKLPDTDRENLTREKAIALMLAQPSMIKRPVLEAGGKLLVGFKPESYGAEFEK